MSENTPETILENAGLDSGDHEPSMEDILASIRQIIAEDKTEDMLDASDDKGEEVPKATSPELASDAHAELIQNVDLSTTQNAENIKNETAIPEPLELENREQEIVTKAIKLNENTSENTAENDEEDILELINFVDENTQEQEVEALNDDTNDVIAESIEPAIDEGLDLLVTPVDEPTEDKVLNKPAFESEYEDLTQLVVPQVEEKSLEIAHENADFTLSEDDEFISGIDELAIPEISGEAQTVKSFEDVIPKQVQTEEEIIDEMAMLAPVHVTEMSESEEMPVSFAVENASTEEASLVGSIEKENAFEELSPLDEILSELEGGMPPSEDLSVDMSTVKSAENDVAKNAVDTSVNIQSPDEDIVLVKSLLADLMDGPETEQLSATVAQGGVYETTEAETNILDEVLEKAVEDEVALHEAMTALTAGSQKTTINTDGDLQDEQVQEQGSDSLLDIVQQVNVSTQSFELDDTVSNDDVVVLEKVDFSSQMALAGKASVALAAVGAGMAVTKKEDQSANEVEQEATTPNDTKLELELDPELGVEVENEAEITAPVVLKAEDDQYPTPQPTQTLDISDPKEDNIMGQAAKSDSILDEGTTRGTMDAFASLNSAVKEKAETQFRGPAIADLVHEALRPMLKEWLDKNLKTIVEQAVTKEVKRISSGK